MKKSIRLGLCCLSLLGVLVVSLAGTVSVRAEDGTPPPTEAPIVVTPLSDVLLWCPLKIAPVANLNGCTDSYTSFENLLAYLSVNEPNRAGVIWIGEAYDSGVNDATVTSFVLDGATNFPTLKDYGLTLRGGWNGDSAGTIVIGDPAEFNATLSIVNWNADVALNDLLLTETNGPGMNVTFSGIGPSPRGAGLAVATTGNVQLHNVDATKNNSNGVLIDNRLGSGTVLVKNGNFNENGMGIYGGLGIYVFSNSAITIKNVTANGNAWNGAQFFNDAALPSEGDIVMMGTNTFSNNNWEGLMISSPGNVTLKNIDVSGNGLTGAYIYNASGTGSVTFAGTNTVKNNAGSGMYVYSNGVMTVRNVTATGNGAEGALLMSGLGNSPNQIIFAGTNVFQENATSDPEYYFDLYTAFGDRFAQYRNVITSHYIVLTPVDQLPGVLPEGVTFISGLPVAQTGQEVRLSFYIPYELQDAEFAVLYWDGSQWLNLETATFEDGRIVIDSGHKTEYGSFEATVNFGGIFVLVQKTNQ